MNDNQNYFTNPKAPTLVATYNAAISASSPITLNSGTTSVEVTAITKGIFLKWNGAVSSSSFDEFIGAGLAKVFVVPAAATSVNFIEQAASGAVVCIEK